MRASRPVAQFSAAAAAISAAAFAARTHAAAESKEERNAALKNSTAMGISKGGNLFVASWGSKIYKSKAHALGNADTAVYAPALFIDTEQRMSKIWGLIVDDETNSLYAVDNNLRKIWKISPILGTFASISFNAYITHYFCFRRRCYACL